MARTLEFGGKRWEYGWWKGERLSGTADKPYALDLETELIRLARLPEEGEDASEVPTDPTHIPKPALGMACDGSKLFLIHPSRFSDFLIVNRSQAAVGHNISFDWWCLHEVVDNAAKAVLWSLGEGKLADTMILDMLLQLSSGEYRHGFRGEADDSVYATNLGVLAEEYGVGEVDKTDKYRMRFGELLGLSEAEMDAHPEAEGFYSYALKDVIATYFIYPQQRKQALDRMKKAGWSPNPKPSYEIRHDALEKFGPLSLYLQVKAAIALAQLGRTPIRIDEEKQKEREEATRARYTAALEILKKEVPNLIKTSPAKYKKQVVNGEKVSVCVRPAEVLLTSRSMVPQMDKGVLKEKLLEIAAELKVPVPKSDGKKKGDSLSTKDWEPYAAQSPFIAAWVDLAREAKLLEFLVSIRAPQVYSRYELLKRTGRTSAKAYRDRRGVYLPSVNVQQLPRESKKHPERSVRTLFLPPKRCKWFECDYGYIELRSWAAVCKARFGWSKMAEATVEHTLHGGIDPHQRTAAAILGVSESEFLRMEKDKQTDFRQKAKAANFGYIGGLGVSTFQVYAKTQYGADFTPQEAKEVKKTWLALYPEGKLYLADRTQEAMEWNAGKKLKDMNWLQRRRLSDFLRGFWVDSEGEVWEETDPLGEDEDQKPKPPTATEKDWYWSILHQIAAGKKDEQALEDIKKRKITARVRNLIRFRACTLTGRVRGNVKYTDNCNTPFQGSAADGAKEAMWQLMKRGYKLLAFIHDAFAVALPGPDYKKQAEDVRQIMCKAMESVLGQGIPVAADGVIGDCWMKG